MTRRDKIGVAASSGKPLYCHHKITRSKTVFDTPARAIQTQIKRRFT
jgi:hypothetical protein